MNGPGWNADISIDAALATRAIDEQFPALAGTALVAFGIGWDNAAFLVDERIVFRFPRRRIAVRLIERECALLPMLAPILPLAISAPQYVGMKSAIYPAPFAGYERIAGSTACAVPLDDDARAALALPLARFLRALHGVDPAAFVACGLPPDDIGRLDFRKRVQFARDRVAALADVGIGDGTAFIAWLEAHPPQPIEPADRRIVHGDLYARHVILDERRKPRGIIDWGDIHLGDPALDIAIAHLMLPARAHALFREAYGTIDERTWSGARFRAIYHAILEIDYGVRADDPGMRTIGTAALALLRDIVHG